MKVTFLRRNLSTLLAAPWSLYRTLDMTHTFHARLVLSVNAAGHLGGLGCLVLEAGRTNVLELHL